VSDRWHTLLRPEGSGLDVQVLKLLCIHVAD